jgi:hypothetical protein
MQPNILQSAIPLNSIMLNLKKYSPRTSIMEFGSAWIRNFWPDFELLMDPDPSLYQMPITKIISSFVNNYL